MTKALESDVTCGADRLRSFSRAPVIGLFLMTLNVATQYEVLAQPPENPGVSFWLINQSPDSVAELLMHVAKKEIVIPARGVPIAITHAARSQTADEVLAGFNTALQSNG
ncbi:MAG TPA: hypothetical protein VIW47_01630 [Nitrospiraceae bacterium]|jgi:hypothetical protein